MEAMGIQSEDPRLAGLQLPPMPTQQNQDPRLAGLIIPGSPEAANRSPDALQRGIDIGAGNTREHQGDVLGEAFDAVTRTYEAMKEHPGQIIPGIAEALTGGAISMGSMAAGGIGGAGAALFGGDFTDTSQRIQQAITEALHAEPETEVGKEASKILNLPGDAAQRLGDWVFDKTGSPEAATAALTIANGAMLMLGGKKAAGKGASLGEIRDAVDASAQQHGLSPAQAQQFKQGVVPELQPGQVEQVEGAPPPERTPQPRPMGIQMQPAEEIQGAAPPAEPTGGAPEPGEAIKGAPAPKEAPPTGGEPRGPEEEVTAGPVKSDRQTELERLRELAATPEAQAHLDTQIAAEEKAQRKAFEEEEKRAKGAAGAAELRRMAAQTSDQAIREELMAKAEKLSPTPPEPKEKVTGEVIFPEPGGERRTDLALPGQRALPAPEEKAAAFPSPGEEKPAEPESTPAKQTYTRGSSPLFRSIVDELGGVHVSEREDAGFDKRNPVMLTGKTPGGKMRGPLFTKKGATMDRLVEWMQGKGYLTDADVSEADANLPGGSHQLAYDMLQREHASPGSQMPQQFQTEAYAGMNEAERQKAVVSEAERLGIEHIGRTLQSIERDVYAARDQQLGKQYEMDLGAHHGEIAKANGKNPDAVERLAVQHENDHEAFMEGVRRINASDTEPVTGAREGAEPGPGQAPGQPAVRGEHPAAAEVAAGPGAVRGEPGAGAARPGQRAEAGPALPGARAEPGAAARHEAGKPVEELKLTGSKRKADVLEQAHGQKSLFEKGELPEGWSIEPMRKPQEGMDAHVPHAKKLLDKFGMGWAHHGVEYGLEEIPQGSAVVSLRNDGTYAIKVHPEWAANADDASLARSMMHEHMHIVDQQGSLYSQHPDMATEYRNGLVRGVGPAAKELEGLYREGKLQMLEYPFGATHGDLHESMPYTQAELFAQAMVARATPGLREVIAREAPNAEAFLADARAHATEEGHNVYAHPNWPERLAALQDSFAARRSGERVLPPESAGAGGVRPGRPTEPLYSRGLSKEDEAKVLKDTLSKAFPDRDRERMAQAARDEDDMLAKGEVSEAKGLNSLPPDQREAVEFLQGRGHDVGDILGYHHYAGVEQPKPTGGGFKGAGADMAKVFSPAGSGKEAGTMRDIMRHNLGQVMREREMALERLKDHARELNKLTRTDQLRFIDAMERGKFFANEKYQKIADDLRDFLDFKRDEVIALGKGHLENILENYFPHIWKEKEQLQSFIGRRPMAPTGFLQQRSIPLTSDGMRWRAYDKDNGFIKSFDTEDEAKAAMPEGGRVGQPLTPITSNPVELAMLKSREIDRYLSGHRIMNEAKDAGLMRLVEDGKRGPEGYTRIKDPIARGWEQGKHGEYWALDGAARLLNNHLSPGLRGNNFFEAWRGLGSALNGLQLGFSLFHLGFTTLDAMTSRAALGVKQLSRGDVIKGFGNVVMGLNPVQPFLNIYKGDKLLRAYLGRLDDPVFAPIADAIEQAGGRVRLDDFYRNVEVNAFQQALRRNDYLAAGAKALPTLLDRANAPVFEQLVPRQKLGVFFDMARDWLDTHPDATLEDRRAGLGKLWDSVDNRMGQLVYDNLFWNRALKDGLMATVRSVGWNLGTFRELGGGVMDMFNLKEIARNKSLSDRTAYVVALPLIAGVYGAITQMLYGAGPPEDLKDLFAPRTGRKRPDGSLDRVQLPMYTKDIAAYWKDVSGAAKYGEDPTQTLKNKLHPLLSTFSQMLENKDFFGASIRNPADPAVKQVQDEAAYILQQMLPFSVRNYQQQAKVSKTEPSVPGYLFENPAMVGVTPAPGYVVKSEAQMESSEVSKLRDPLMKRFREDLQNGEPTAESVRRMRAAGLSTRDIRYVLRSAGPPGPHRLKHFGASP
jgi:hypothetical protein